MAKTKVIKPARTVQKKAVKEPKKVDFVEKVAKETKKPEPVKPELKKRRGLITKPLKKKEVDSKKFKSINGFYVPRKFNAEKVKKEILEQAKAALKAMLKFNKEHSKPNLFAEANDSIAVRFHLKKPRVHGLRKFKVIQLPHSDRDPGNSTVCLILSDQNAKTLRNPKNWPNEVDKNAQIWKDWLREEHGITGNEVDKVMTYVQFKREYRSKIDIARFLRSYDKIVIHEQLFKTMVKHFGKSCWNTNLFPVKVNVRSGKLKENILKAYSQETLLSPLNSITHVLRIGNIHQKPEFLLENLSAVLDAAAVILPGGLYNLRRAGIAWMTTNQELPVYVDFGAANEVIAKVPEEKIEVIEDECSTLPDGLKIRISSKGKIEVLDEQSGEPIFYPTIEDEWEKHDDLKPKHSKDSLIAREVKKRKVQEIKKLAKKARLAKGNANKKE